MGPKLSTPDEVAAPTSHATRTSRRLTRTQQVREARDLKARDHELFTRELASIVWVPLAKPVRTGWERTLVARADLRKSPEARYLSRVLALVNHTQVSRRRDFATRDWRHGNRMRPTEMRPREVDLATYQAMTPRLRSYFELRVRRPSKRAARYGAQIHVSFVVARPWKFVARVRPYFQTHERVMGFNPDSDREWIRVKLYGPRWRIRHLMRSARGRCHDDYWREESESPRVPLDSCDAKDYDLSEQASKQLALGY